VRPVADRLKLLLSRGENAVLDIAEAVCSSVAREYVVRTATALFLQAHFNREFISHPRRNLPDLVLVTIEN
jgi:hypothetical protein